MCGLFNVAPRSAMYLDRSRRISSIAAGEKHGFDKESDSTWMLAGDWQEACADLIALVNEYEAGPHLKQNIS